MEPGSTRWNAAFALAAAAVAIALYWSTLAAPFIFDDLPHIIGNPGIRDLGDLTAIVAGGYQETRPLFMLTAAVNWAIGGPDPTGYHAVNIALHAGCAVLVFFVAVAIRRDLKQRLPGFPEVAALVFAAHPLASESVAYVSARPGLMVGCLALATLLLYRRKSTIAATICCALAMFCKESAVSIPILVLCYAALIEARGDWRGAWRAHRRRIAPLLATAAIVPLLLVVADNPHAGSIGGVRLPALDHYQLQPAVIAQMMRLSVAPIGQSFDHQIPGGGALVTLASVAAIAVLIAIAVAARRRAPIAALGIVWFFVALAPTNPGVPFPNFIAERYVYLSLVGVAAIAGWVFALGWARSRTVAMLAGVAAIATLCALSVSRARLYAEPIALWRATAETSPDNPRPHVNLGILLAERGDFDEAVAELERAVALAPGDAYARYNLGALQERRGELAAATRSFRAALASVERPRYRVSLARLLNARGKAAARDGELDDAERLLREAVEVDAPGYASPVYNLGVVLDRTGRSAEARELWQRALAIDPEHPGARRKLGRQTGAP